MQTQSPCCACTEQVAEDPILIVNFWTWLNGNWQLIENAELIMRDRALKFGRVLFTLDSIEHDEMIALGQVTEYKEPVEE